MPATEPIVVHPQEWTFENAGGSGRFRWQTLISADRTPSEALTAGIAQLAPGSGNGFRPHRHRQPEIYHVLAGEGIISINDRDYVIGTGSTVYIPGNARHDLRNTGTGPLRFLYAFPADSFDRIRYDFGPDAG